MPSNYVPRTPRRETTVQQRVVIIWLRFKQNLKFKDIATQLSIPEPTVRRIWHRTVQQAVDSNDINDLLACVENLPRSGRPPIIIEGTPASAQLRDAFLQYGDMSLQAVAWNIMGLKTSQSVVYNVAREHRDPDHPFAIVRRVQLIKPHVTLDQQDLREQLAEWLYNALEAGCLIVATDETYISFGAPYRDKKFVNRPQGHRDPYEFAGHNDSELFTLMLVSCIGPCPKPPAFIWEGQSDDEVQRSDIEIAVWNTRQIELSQLHIKQANEDKSSQAYEAVQQANALLDITNAEILNRAPIIQPRRRYGNVKKPHQFRHKQAKQVFKPNLFKRGAGDGIDAWIYRRYLLEHLIPYYRRCQQHANGLPWKPKVYLIEDNVKLHKRAWDFIDDEVKAGIERPPFWASNSPDLNPSEPCWGYLKRKIPDFEMTMTSSAASKYQAKQCIYAAVKSDDYYRIAQHQLGKLKDKALKVWKRHGRNNFNG